MRKIHALLAVLVLSLASCGGSNDAAGGHDHDDHSHEEESGDHAHAVEIGSPAGASEADRTIEVSAKDYSFDPSSIEIEEKEVVEFVVTNEGTQPHEFAIGDQAFHNDAQGGHHDHGDQSTGVLEPGESGSITWRFTTVANILFACHVEDHYERNMLGSIRVVL